MIQVVLDTNIVVSALLQPLGPPAQVFTLAIRGSLQLCVTGKVYAEYEEVISRPRFQRPEDVTNARRPPVRTASDRNGQTIARHHHSRRNGSVAPLSNVQATLRAVPGLTGQHTARCI